MSLQPLAQASAFAIYTYTRNAEERYFSCTVTIYFCVLRRLKMLKQFQIIIEPYIHNEVIFCPLRDVNVCFNNVSHIHSYTTFCSVHIFASLRQFPVNDAVALDAD